MAASFIRVIGRTKMSNATLTAFRFSRLQLNLEQHRNHSHYLMRYLRELYLKRENLGPDKLRRRSEWINWNYDSEIFSFGKRLGEEFQDATLRQAFIHPSYLEAETKKRSELGIDLDSVPFRLEDNSELVARGSELTSSYIKVYLRNMYPYMFEECLSAIHDFLVTEELLANIAKHLGCSDLILSEDFPVNQKTLSDTFKALVGALLKDRGHEQAERFVRDFVLTHLVGKDINEMWELINPMGLLTAVLTLQGRGAPESRLLWKSGASTIMALYWVGIYSDKQLIAKSPGETVLIAEEMAAREAIKKIMKTEDSRPALILGRLADSLKLDYSRKNASAEETIKKCFEPGRSSVSVS